MDKAARRFASWVLTIHLIVLALLIVIVFFASQGVYSSSRQQALEQLRVRQELLAAQTSRGIESFHRTILDTLDLEQHANARQLSVTPIIWEQLSGKVTSVIELDRSGRAVRRVFSDAPPTTRQIAALAGFIQPGIRVRHDSADRAASIIAAVQTDNSIVAAVIPARSIETRFLNDLNHSESIGSMLVDENLRVVSAEQRELIGMDMTQTRIDPRIGVMIDEYVRRGQRGSREFLDPLHLSGVTLDPAIVTVQPVDLPDGTRWWLAVSSKLSEIETFLNQFFRRTIIGAGLVILAMTGVLVSTSVQMIRGRLRLERLQTEMLTRELAQAREIQLMWLPEHQGNKINCDIAAINRPASHVSGDFYNWFELPDGRCVIVVGDVTGHGLPAAFLMATTQLLVRMTMERLGDPGACLRYVNRQLCKHVFSGQFVTMLIMVLDTQRGVAEIATAGHPPPLIGEGHEFRSLPIDAQLVLAIEPDLAYRTQRVELKPASSVLLYTDGVTDLKSPAGERLHPDGLERCLYGRFDSAQSLLETAMDAIESFRAGREPADDLTLVAIQLAPAPSSPPPAPPQPEPAAARTA